MGESTLTRALLAIYMSGSSRVSQLHVVFCLHLHVLGIFRFSVVKHIIQVYIFLVFHACVIGVHMSLCMVCLLD